MTYNRNSIFFFKLLIVDFVSKYLLLFSKVLLESVLWNSIIPFSRLETIHLSFVTWQFEIAMQIDYLYFYKMKFKKL